MNMNILEKNVSAMGQLFNLFDTMAEKSQEEKINLSTTDFILLRDMVKVMLDANAFVLDLVNDAKD